VRPIAAKALQARLGLLANAGDAIHLQRFFKTGKGEYGEGDVFRGIRVPELRKLAKEAAGTPLDEVSKLLDSKFHEDRALAVILLCDAFAKTGESERKRIFDLYLSKSDRINNWDLVDISCPNIVGAYLFDKSRSVLDKLAKSPLLWERRISVVSTLFFIRKGQIDDALRIAKKLLGDRHDLMHKAVGWMLREAGKKDLKALRAFLDEHAATMPRTALRYAMEKLPEAERQSYLRLGRRGSA